MRHALSLAIGSQAMVALLDTARLDTDEARDVTHFVCRAIVNEARRLVEAQEMSADEHAAAGAPTS